MARTRRIIVHCTGCGETWESRTDIVGQPCGAGEVRPASEAEATRYCNQEA